jgi:transposase
MSLELQAVAAPRADRRDGALAVSASSESVQGHSRLGRAGSESGHVRCAAKSGSQFRALATWRRGALRVDGAAQDVIQAPNRSLESCATNSATMNGPPSNLCSRTNRVVFGGARNLIERFFNKIKQCRRVATRYDKLAANYLAFVKLASIRIWLRANESTP